MKRAFLLLGFVACQGPAPKSAPPARVITEGDLVKVTLTPEAVKRLGLTLAVVETRAMPERRKVGGEVTVPSGGALSLTAPVAATVLQRTATVGRQVKRGDSLAVLAPLAPVDRDTQAQSTRGASAAAARLEAADQQLKRAERLLAEGAGSAKLVEQAKAERDVAKAEGDAATQRLSNVSADPLAADVSVVIRAPHDGVVRQVGVSPGQIVAAGTMLFEIVGSSAFWVRVPLFVPEARRVQQDAPASVGAMGGQQKAHEALPAHAPQSADPATATIDLYYELATPHDFRPGERVDVELTYRGEAESLVVPASAIVHDASGGAWLYEALSGEVFARRRVEVSRVAADRAVLARGIAAGKSVVAIGASELFGVEFGAGH